MTCSLRGVERRLEDRAVTMDQAARANRVARPGPEGIGGGAATDVEAAVSPAGLLNCQTVQEIGGEVGLTSRRPDGPAARREQLEPITPQPPAPSVQEAEPIPMREDSSSREVCGQDEPTGPELVGKADGGEDQSQPSFDPRTLTQLQRKLFEAVSGNGEFKPIAELIGEVYGPEDLQEYLTRGKRSNVVSAKFRVLVKNTNGILPPGKKIISMRPKGYARTDLRPAEDGRFNPKETLSTLQYQLYSAVNEGEGSLKPGELVRRVYGERYADLYGENGGPYSNEGENLRMLISNTNKRLPREERIISTQGGYMVARNSPSAVFRPVDIAGNALAYLEHFEQLVSGKSFNSVEELVDYLCKGANLSPSSVKKVMRKTGSSWSDLKAIINKPERKPVSTNDERLTRIRDRIGEK